MSFQIILKRTLDQDTLARIAAEVASMSGASSDQIASALSSKDISIGKEFSEEKALELKAHFEKLGGAVTVNNLTVAAPTTSNLDDDEEEDEDGRVLTDAEYIKALSARADIFYTEKDRKLQVLMPIFLIIGIALSAYVTWVLDLSTFAPDFVDRVLKKQTVVLGEEINLDEELDEEKEEEEKEEFKEEKKELKPKEKKGSGGKKSGGGDPASVVTKKGVLGVLSGAITGTQVANADVFGKGGYSAGLDAVLAGTGGLKQGGGGGSGRAGAAGIGFGSGVGSGFGGGSGGVDALDGLMGGSGATVKLKKKKTLRVKQPTGASGAGLSGGRSRANIMRVVRQNLAALRYAFNKRLRDKPGLRGKVTVKWAIDEFGNVLFAKVVSSTVNDPDFEQTVMKKVKLWKFGKIDKPGDVTEVTYPFVFTQ